MNLLNNFENMAMSKVAGSNPEAAAVLEMIQNHPGGLDGLVQSFRTSGLSGVVNSWIGNGENQAVSPAQINEALGSEKVQEVAQKLGVSPEAASSTLAKILPTMIDKLSPNGQMPDRSSILQMGESMLSSLGKTGTNS